MTIGAPVRRVTLAKDAALTAAWVAGILAAIQFVIHVFNGIAWFVVAVRGPSSVVGVAGGGIYDEVAVSVTSLVSGMALDLVRAIVFMVVPYAIGVFLVLWLLPEPGEPSLRKLTVRGLLASCAGALLASISDIVVSVFTARMDLVPSLLGLIPSAASHAPVVVLVLVVRHLVPRRAQP